MATGLDLLEGGAEHILRPPDDGMLAGLLLRGSGDRRSRRRSRVPTSERTRRAAAAPTANETFTWRARCVVGRRLLDLRARLLRPIGVQLAGKRQRHLARDSDTTSACASSDASRGPLASKAVMHPPPQTRRSNLPDAGLAGAVATVAATGAAAASPARRRAPAAGGRRELRCPRRRGLGRPPRAGAAPAACSAAGAPGARALRRAAAPPARPGAAADRPAAPSARPRTGRAPPSRTAGAASADAPPRRPRAPSDRTAPETARRGAGRQRARLRDLLRRRVDQIGDVDRPAAAHPGDHLQVAQEAQE